MLLSGICSGMELHRIAAWKPVFASLLILLLFPHVLLVEHSDLEPSIPAEALTKVGIVWSMFGVVHSPGSTALTEPTGINLGLSSIDKWWVHEQKVGSLNKKVGH